MQNKLVNNRSNKRKHISDHQNLLEERSRLLKENARLLKESARIIQEINNKDKEHHNLFENIELKNKIQKLKSENQILEAIIQDRNEIYNSKNQNSFIVENNTLNSPSIKTEGNNPPKSQFNPDDFLIKEEEKNIEQIDRDLFMHNSFFTSSDLDTKKNDNSNTNLNLSLSDFQFS